MKQIFLSFILISISIIMLQASDTLRPQTPIPHYYYISENVLFYNTFDSVSLAGTITYPSSKGKFPAVILISGSGLQDRNEEIFGHKPFMVLADHLTKNGIAVLRYDDRGFGESGKGKGDLTTFSNKRDAGSAIDFLKSMKYVDKKRVGVIGHSEGGTIAYMLGAERKDVKFIVSLAGSSVRGDTLLLSQTRALSKAMKNSDQMIEFVSLGNRNLYSIVSQSNSNDSIFRNTLLNYINKNYPFFSDDRKKAMINQLSNEWLYEFIKLDPYQYITRINVPVLALNGNKDLQVLSHLNLSNLERGLIEGGNKNYKIYELDSLNHLFQHCHTGLPGEYKKIKETFSPEVLDIITAWILNK